MHKRNKNRLRYSVEPGRLVWIGLLSTAYIVVQRVYGRCTVIVCDILKLGGETIIILGVSLLFELCNQARIECIGVVIIRLVDLVIFVCLRYR